MTTVAEVYEASPVKRRRRTNAELDIIDDAIIAAVETEQPVTLRGVYYRVVSAGAVGKTEAGYQLVGRELLKLRRAGRVPYSSITDGTRLVRKPPSWSNVDEMLETASRSYRRALWQDQDVELIVLSEKDAISGTVWPITAKYDVELGIVRGYSSETFVYSIAESVQFNTLNGKVSYLYQLGDHDPSGLDAWRDFTVKVKRFAPGAAVFFERLAVTPSQITELHLPTRPTKKSDTRSTSFSGESVEVDAIPPSMLRRIVEDAIVSHIDPEAYRLHRIAEQSERDILASMRRSAW